MFPWEGSGFRILVDMFMVRGEIRSSSRKASIVKCWIKRGYNPYKSSGGITLGPIYRS